MTEDIDSSKKVEIDRETAEKEFSRLCVSWKIDENKGSESGASESVIEAILKGKIVIATGTGSKLVMVQFLNDKIGEFEALTYRFPIASDMMQMDNFKESQQFKRAVAMIASVTGVGDKLIAKMGAPDFNLGQAIAFCFLGA